MDEVTFVLAEPEKNTFSNGLRILAYNSLKGQGVVLDIKDNTEDW